jgi:uncharacterized protein YggU (UPF0235/DUF167 family)
VPRPGIGRHEGKTGCTLAVRITARAGRSKITDVLPDGTVRIHIAAPPVDGEANAKLLALLSELLKIPKSRIAIVAGFSARDKLISVLGLDAATVQARIAAQLR